MKTTYIKRTREQLFDEVWDEPISKLSKKYGLSDVGLAKICKKHSIPLPGRGYWAKKANGKPVPERPTLPEIYEDKDYYETIYFDNKPKCEGEKNTTDEIAEFERSSENKIKVAVGSKLINPTVIQTENSIKNNGPDKKGLYSPKDKDCLNIKVCKESITRSLNIIDALVGALLKRGYDLEPHRVFNTESIHININGIHLEVVLEETVRRIDHVLTAQEKKKKSRDNWHYFHIPQYDYIPTGKLTLRISRCWPYIGRISWADGKIQRVENCLNDFVISLRKAAIAIQQKQDEDNKREREREILQAQTDEYEKQREDETQKIEQLCNEAENWRKSKLIREYISEVVQYSKAPISPELKSWGEWASKQADRLDPRIENPDSILDMDFEEFQKIYSTDKLEQ